MSNTDAPTAVLAAVQLHGVSDGEFSSSLQELSRLVTTLGLRPVGRVTQRRSKLAAGKVFGDGKLRELAQWTGGTGEVSGYVALKQRRAAEAAEAQDGVEDEDDGEVADWPQDGPEADDGDDNSTPMDLAMEGDDAPAEDRRDEVAEGNSIEVEEGDRDHDGAGEIRDVPYRDVKVVVVDHELTPTQQRNLERATGAEVLDRTSVILEIFARHAKSREARLQVEIAKLRYLAPRLRESSGGEDRVRGGVGGKGAGESALELDRRRIRDRIAELRRELQAIEGGAGVRRARRHNLSTVALVGYTNAGKSSLMRALTGGEVYVADKLFATLDTTVRTLHPRTEPPILVSDTVGFIKKLPHDLVASFRSTLDEANEADLLLHVLDASDDACESHYAVTQQVLSEIGADRKNALILLNKADLLTPEQRHARLVAFPQGVFLSAHRKEDVAALRERILEHFAGAFETGELLVPWADYGRIAELRAQCQVLAQRDAGEGAYVTVRGPQTHVQRWRGLFGVPPAGA